MVILTELAEASYDVFLSFRGADTRLGFTNHLYNALLDANLTTFLDDEEIPTGEFLKPELETAIKASRASVIVLSENYASSTWCLDELVLILEQKRISNQIVIPVFYHVEPTHVRKQQSSFGEAMEKHKLKIKEATNEEERRRLGEKMEKWKEALTQVSNLKGKDASGRKEIELIEEVVTEIHRRLGGALSNTLPLLTGRYKDINHINWWLTDDSSHTADILTVVGMSGIGKTYLAKYIYNQHSAKFQKGSFIEGINARCNERFNGLLKLQKQLLGDISKKVPLKDNDVFVCTSMIEKALAHKRVFIVLDDIGSLDQLDALLGNKGLHPGSKIIITTKYASFTERCAIFNSQLQPKHDKLSLNGLNEYESLELLCLHAFKSRNPIEGYEEVLEELVKYCDGHPLALMVLGRSLHKRDVAYWEECIKGLKKEPHYDIKKALRMSFDLLSSDNDKDLFKHIACFFVGINRDVIEIILNACDINTRSGIINLIERCLLSIGWNNELVMHQLVQEMGRDLVRQESPDRPWERSRIWCHKESFKVLEQEKGTENILGIALDMRMLEKERLHGSLQLKTEALNKMGNLRLLQLNYTAIKGSYKNISKELRWLCMHGFHLKSIPSELPMENLVVLDMSYSNIESFDMSYRKSHSLLNMLKGLTGSSSTDKPLLGSLKILDLSFCEQLRSLGGFYELPVLERLIISNCTNLIQVCESIKHCVELVFIDLSHCKNLKKLPRTVGMLKKVKTILSNGCDLSVFPIETRYMDSLQTIEANNIGINSQTYSSIVVDVVPRDLRSFASSLPASLVCLKLVNNNLSNKSFPVDFSSLSMLEELHLDNNPIVSMPSCIRTLPRLQRLVMRSCKMLKTVEHPPSSLRNLNVYDGDSLRELKFNPEMSPLGLTMELRLGSFVIEGLIKVQPLAYVEDEVLCSLGWANFELIKNQRLTFIDGSNKHSTFEIQMYYEFGIFSTLYKGREMPNWISCRMKGSSISFTIPSSLNKLKGLNLCCRMEKLDEGILLPWITIINTTKKHTWRYSCYISSKVIVAEERLIFVSHWMFGKNEMEDGDEFSIELHSIGVGATRECGVGLVYDDGRKKGDALGYYKSWNHIIGGDLSPFQFDTHSGYYLDYIRFWAERNSFRAFSQQKSDLTVYRHRRKEIELIEEVVTEIHRRLGGALSNTLPLLTGRYKDINHINWWLTDDSSHTADILTVVGMSGIGKTYLAKYIYNQHSAKFQKGSFIEGINARCNERFNGLLKLQKQLLGDISKKVPLKDNDVFVCTSMIEKALAHKRVFIVLDDIGSLDQLDALLGNKGLHPGSKIIITTKYASFTERCAIFNSQLQPKHDKLSLNGLNEYESLELLCLHAFKSRNPIEGYEEVLEELVKYCDGHPLALMVLGRSLHKRDVAYWEECIKGLKKEPHYDIKKALRMSFDLLSSDNDKDLFKHIACFFVGINRDVIEIILNACDINTRSGIINLIERCLLSIGWNNELVMHQLVQEMGRDLVRQESPDRPWERSRIWCHKESFKVLEQEKGTENILGIALDMRMLEKERLHGSLQLKTEALNKMGNLRLLQLNYTAIKGSYKNISKELRWLCMHGFHLKSIPSELPMENLVVLDMSYSNIESFDMSYRKSHSLLNMLKGLTGSSSTDKPLLGSLKILDLSFCEQLRSLGGFYELPVLERLIISNCTNLIQVCESIKHCVELVFIDLSHCKNLKKLPRTVGMLKKVKTILSNGCDLSVFPIETRYMDSLQTIEANNIGINSQTYSSIVVDVVPRDLRSFASSLPASLVCLKLVNNNLSNKSFPVDFSSLSMLEELHLDNNPIVSMPSCIRTLPRLQRLVMRSCKMLKTVEHPPSSLRNLNVYDGDSLRELKFNPEMSPLGLTMELRLGSFVIEGLIKVQPLAYVEDEVLCSLGWANFELIKNQRLTFIDGSNKHSTFEIQMYYEFGIFSTLYKGREMPNWISCRMKGSSISFTIPSSPNKLKGLNLCCRMEKLDEGILLPWITIINTTKKHTWRYSCYISSKVIVAEERLIFVSHWMFGKNEMEDGDEFSIELHSIGVGATRECGVGLVYDDGRKKGDALGYYKSWNHIIGGDLSPFQFDTHSGYYLDYIRFWAERNSFRAFSQQKSDLTVYRHRRGSRDGVLETKRNGSVVEKMIESLRTKIVIVEFIYNIFKSSKVKMPSHLRFSLKLYTCSRFFHMLYFLLVLAACN